MGKMQGFRGTSTYPFNMSYFKRNLKGLQRDTIEIGSILPQNPQLMIKRMKGSDFAEVGDSQNWQVVPTPSC